MSNKPYLTAQEAIDELKISMATLYSYVSRGLICSEESGEKRRSRRYRAEDVAALKERKERRHNPAVVAESALYWGDPVLESAITLIEEEQLYYRGHNVVALTASNSFEEVANLLWSGSLTHDFFVGEDVTIPERLLQSYHELAPALHHLPALETFQSLLPVFAADDLAAHDLSPASVMRTGIRIMLLLPLVLTGKVTAQSIPIQLAQHWAPDQPAAAQLLNAALILCADHELNASSFVVRCVVSTGATPYAGVQAGLAALHGPKHGGDTLRTERFFADARVDLRNAITQRVKEGERLPGFKHLLYPNGDPRARCLLTLAKQTMPQAEALLLGERIAEEVKSHFAVYPNLDFGLVTIAQSLGLPAGSALLLFALGRTAGWIAHMLEQYEHAQLIRPRARYTGKRP